MKLSCIIISLLTILFLMSSCDKNDFVTESETTQFIVDGMISGNAFFDSDGDGIGDQPLTGSRIYYVDSLYKEYNINFNLDSNVLYVEVDEFGQYVFQGLPPSSGKILMLVGLFNSDSTNYWDNQPLQGFDSEPDGDSRETDLGRNIYIELLTDEVDNGNDFLVSQLPVRIGGCFTIDTNHDGVGNEPLPFYEIKLYDRLPNNEPGTTLVWQGMSGADGCYAIYDIDPGKYILYLDGGSSYAVISGNDDTPDPDGQGDPNNPQWIPVDLGFDESDLDNNYILQSVKGTISGAVFNDYNLDDVEDYGLSHITVSLYESVLGEKGKFISNQDTDDDGKYLFSDLIPGEYIVELPWASNNFYVFLKVGDHSPDGDVADDAFHQNNKLLVTLNPIEVDADNNFTIDIVKGRISGWVVEDIDNDGDGEKPVKNNVLLLSYRSSDGGPIWIDSSTWNEEVAYSDWNGYYYFTSSIPDTGKFVINFAGTGEYMYQCLSSEDITPELNEPQNQHPLCSMIQVDLLSNVSVDRNNIYTIDIK